MHRFPECRYINNLFNKYSQILSFFDNLECKRFSRLKTKKLEHIPDFSSSWVCIYVMIVFCVSSKRGHMCPFLNRRPLAFKWLLTEWWQLGANCVRFPNYESCQIKKRILWYWKHRVNQQSDWLKKLKLGE